MWASDASVWLGTALRLAVAVVCGGIIGLERGNKRRPAGMRTHMLLCLGAALTMMLGQYLFTFLPLFSSVEDTDVVRFGAKAISGIGFLGAGTILINGQRQIKGLTTAAGLFSATCMGLAIGAGFYLGALVACLIIFLTITLLTRTEVRMIRHSRNMTLYVELGRPDVLGQLITELKSGGVVISDVELQKPQTPEHPYPAANFWLWLPRHTPHEGIVAAVAALDGVQAVEEL